MPLYNSSLKIYLKDFRTRSIIISSAILLSQISKPSHLHTGLYLGLRQRQQHSTGKHRDFWQELYICCKSSNRAKATVIRCMGISIPLYNQNQPFSSSSVEAIIACSNCWYGSLVVSSSLYVLYEFVECERKFGVKAESFQNILVSNINQRWQYVFFQILQLKWHQSLDNEHSQIADDPIFTIFCRCINVGRIGNQSETLLFLTQLTLSQPEIV